MIHHLSTDNNEELYSPAKALVKRLAAGVLVINLVIAGIIWFSLIRSRQSYLERAEVTTRNITQILDEDLSGTISKVDIAIQSVTDEAERQLATGTILESALNNFIIREHSRLPELVAFRATSASGDALYGPKVQPAKTISLAQRDYFSHLRDTPDAGLVISKPLIGGISGTWMIILARRYNHPDGGFAGLVYAGISLDYLTKIFEKIDVGSGGLVSLLDSDFNLVARYPEYKTAGRYSGQKIGSPQFHKMIQAGKTSGTYTAISSLDGIERTYSFRTLLFARPFYVFAGVATSEYLAAWHAEVLILSAFMSVFMVITIASAWLIYREWGKSREAERALLKGEQRFRNLMQDVASIAVQGYGPDGTTQYWNNASERLYGYSAQEAIGRNLVDLIIPPEMRSAVEQAITYMAETGQPVPSSELLLMRKDGSRIPVFSNHTIVKVPGHAQELFCLDIDMTELKQAEEEKLALEQQLQQAQKLESLGVLAGGIAHDFNNFLSVIIGHCSLAKLRPTKASDNIRPIEAAAERAAELCQQMLAYAGKSSFTKSLINLRELVDEMVGMSKSTINRNAGIRSNFASDMPLVMADASQIRQVAMNLIINAAEAIGESQGEVCVSLAKRAVRADQNEKDYLGAIIPPGWYACLEVADNGSGMDAETQRRIFEPFYTTKFTGRGLGMSAVLGIIKAHGGALQLVSQPGHGSTFTVYLPLQTGDSTGEENPSRPDPSVPWQGSGTVLLVEDEDQVRMIAKELLEMFGFTVVEAVNGKEALEVYRKSAADITLVLTDIGMPVMDGYALFRELKKLIPELPIVIYSGFGIAEVTSRIASDDIAGFISKPYRPDQLRDVLKNAVEGARKQL
ncbi:MAG: response regulator [Desulfuromonadales bacterium]